MAVEASILCVVGSDDEAGQFKNALAALRISNPVECVHGATEAMTQLDRGAEQGEGGPVLVFLSLAAPEANRLAAWFESHPQNRPTGLIAMTGFKDMRPIIQAYHLGVTAFLEWPLKMEDVRNALTTNHALRLEESERGIAIHPTLGI
jgi:DNA-binding NtrC family response regulator